VSEQQCALARVAEVSGVGLFLGQPVRLRCHPAPVNTGVVFVRTDLPGQPRIPADSAHVPGPQRWTALRNGDAEVRMVEHVLASLYGLGIDNAVIEASSVEMPVGDGSAQTFTVPFLKAGLREQNAPRRRVALKRPVAVIENDIALAAIPAEGLQITYTLDYGQHFVRSQSATVRMSRETFLKEIAPARTYVLRPEVDAFIKLGLGKGATPENTLVLEEDGRITGDLRFPDECARHKILDMIGDLSLIGGVLSGRLIGYKSGHATNAQLARAIAKAAKSPD
jgi:UDP-3-O-acyl N-acetylglucosamine deacetylase